MARANRTLPTWDLKSLYSSMNDPRIARDIRHWKKKADAFADEVRGKLIRLAARPERFEKILERYESILCGSAKPVTYASLLFAETSSEAARGAFLQQTRTAAIDVHNQLVFFDIELGQLPARTLQKLQRGCPRYRHYLSRIASMTPHRLAESEERLMNDRSLTGRSAFVRLFDEEFGEMRFRMLESRGRARELNESQVLTLLHDPARKVRQRAAEAISTGLAANGRRLGYIFNTIVEDHAIEARYRKFPQPEAERHLSNEIEGKIVDTMVDVVVANYDIVREFSRFKAKLLRLPKLADYDRYAPIMKSGEQMSFTQGRDFVLAAFENFSPEFGEIAKQFFTQRWIDAAERDGKRGGAFCSFVTPDTHPFVFINYHGSVRDVFTLAHELGHGIHACLLRSNSYLNFDTPLTLAETASVFSEMLLFDELRSRKLSRERLLALYVGHIENIFATVFRQVALYRFEQDLHRKRAEEGELSVPRINQLWRARQEELYGSSVTLSSGYDRWWGYISHFIHSPFYVYSYAFGELLTLSLYALYREEGDAFVRKYRELLTTGATKSPAEQLKPFGVDLRSRSFWQKGVKAIREMVREVQEI